MTKEKFVRLVKLSLVVFVVSLLLALVINLESLGLWGFLVVPPLYLALWGSMSALFLLGVYSVGLGSDEEEKELGK